jgi:hypothetical protein
MVGNKEVQIWRNMLISSSLVAGRTNYRGIANVVAFAAPKTAGSLTSGAVNVAKAGAN